MKRFSTFTLTISLLASATLVSLAQNATNVVVPAGATNLFAPHARTNTLAASNAALAAAMRSQRVGATTRPTLLQVIGLKPQDLKGLSPEDQNAKVKQLVDKRIEELEKKKKEGQLTDQETRNLAYLIRYKQIKNRPRPGVTSTNAPAATATATNAPAAATNTPAAPEAKH
jgi:hypothetical protein